MIGLNKSLISLPGVHSTDACWLVTNPDSWAHLQERLSHCAQWHRDPRTSLIAPQAIPMCSQDWGPLEGPPAAVNIISEVTGENDPLDLVKLFPKRAR